MEVLDKGRSCHATPVKARAVLALVAPILAWGYAIAMLWTRGYSVLDYPFLILEGHLSVFRQSVGWVLTAFWMARYWPSAIESLRNSCLVWEEGGTLRLATGASVAKEEIEAIELRHGIFSKSVEIKCRNGRTWWQSVMLSQESPINIVRALRASIGSSEKGDSAL